jgi:hypothetical protein
MTTTRAAGSIRSTCQEDADIFLVPQNPPNRRGDVARRQRRRRDLVQQRLKQMIVVTIEQRDAYRRVGERACGVESAKTAADNHHVWGVAHVLDNT